MWRKNKRFWQLCFYAQVEYIFISLIYRRHEIIAISIVKTIFTTQTNINKHTAHLRVLFAMQARVLLNVTHTQRMHLLLVINSRCATATFPAYSIHSQTGKRAHPYSQNYTVINTLTNIHSLEK